MAIAHRRDDLFRACAGSNQAEVEWHAAFPSNRILIVAVTVCLVPFFLNPAAARGRRPHWRMKFQCVAADAVFLLGVSSALCARLPPFASILASLCLPAWSSVHSWLLRLRFGANSATAQLPVHAPALHMSAPMRSGAVDDARLGLA